MAPPRSRSAGSVAGGHGQLELRLIGSHGRHLLPLFRHFRRRVQHGRCLDARATDFHGATARAVAVALLGMDRQQLRASQDPLKQQYRDDSATALVTLKAQGTLGEGITCSVQTGGALAEAGLHPATGGDGLSLCSGDMLLEALAACAGVTLRAVATSLDIPVAGGTVHVEGDLDFRGTLAVSKEAPVGFRAIRVRYALDTAGTHEQLETLIRLTERYCVVYQTLAGSPHLSSTWKTA